MYFGGAFHCIVGCGGSNKISKEELKALCESAREIDELSLVLLISQRTRKWNLKL